jgi:hypothetical protein
MVEFNHLAFVYSVKDAKKLIKSNPKEEILFVLCSFSDLEEFNNLKLKYILIDELIDESTFKRFQKDVYEKSCSFFDKFGDYASYNGFNIGKSIQWELKFILSEPYFYLRCVEPLVKKYNPKKVSLFKNNLLDLSGFFKFFKSDPLLDVLNYLNNKYSFSLNFIKKDDKKIKDQFINFSIHFLRFFQNVSYRINPYLRRKKIVMTCGAIRNIKQFIDSSNKSKDYAFHNILIQDALMFNLSKNFSFETLLNIKSKKNKSIEIFKSNFLKISKEKKFLENFYFEGENLWKLYEDRIRIIFSDLFPLIANYMDSISFKIEKLKPSAVCVMEDVSCLPKIMVYLANNKNIPTFVMQYGLNSEEIPESFWPSESKYKLLWGNADKRFFIKKGAKSKDIFVVGEPRFNNYNSKFNLTKEEFFKKLDIPLNKKILTYMSQYIAFDRVRTFYPGIHFLPKEYIETINLLFKVISKTEDVYLIFSFRRGSDDRKMVEAISRKYLLKNIRFVDPNEISAKDRINLSDAVITSWSTTGMESMILGKPLIVKKMKFREDVVDFLRYGAGYGFSNEEELKKILSNLNKISTNKKYQKNQETYLKDRLFNIGNSNSSPFDVVDKIISK